MIQDFRYRNIVQNNEKPFFFVRSESIGSGNKKNLQKPLNSEAKGLYSS